MLEVVVTFFELKRRVNTKLAIFWGCDTIAFSERYRHEDRV